MEIAASDLTPQSAYKLLIGSVVPRPIAWISTRSARGHSNLAPFSAFTFVSSAPPMIAVSIGRKRDASLKHTAINIARERDFVVNVADMGLIRPLHRSSFEYDESESEIDQLGLITTPSKLVGAARLVEAPISLECMLHSVIEFGTEQAQLIVGQIVYFHVRDGLCTDGKIDSFALNPVARLGGPHYASLGQKITFGLAGSFDPES